MRILLLFGLVSLAWTSPCLARSDPRFQIEAVLSDSAKGWDAGNLDRFMACYERGPATTYVSAGEVTHGYDDIKAKYSSRFAKPGSRSTLSVKVLVFRPLGFAYAYVIGQYILRKDDLKGSEVTGLTTLLFHKTQGGWRIAADDS